MWGRLPPLTGILRAAGTPGYLLAGGDQDAQFARLLLGLRPEYSFAGGSDEEKGVPIGRDEASGFPEAERAAKQSRSPATPSVKAGRM